MAGFDSPGVRLRHPELKLKIPAQMFCMSWCPELEFRVTHRRNSATATGSAGTSPAAASFASPLAGLALKNSTPSFSLQHNDDE